MGKFKTYYIWIGGKAGVLPHNIQAEIEKSAIKGIALGHSFGYWPTALAYLRALMKEGFICRVYREG